MTMAMARTTTISSSENPRALLDTMCSLGLPCEASRHSVVHWIPDSPLRHPWAADWLPWLRIRGRGPLHDQRGYELPAADFIVWRVEEGVKAPKCQAGGLDLGNVTRAGNVAHFGVFFAGESGCDGEDGCFSAPRPGGQGFFRLAF